jgi:protein tyrosine phosphatase (PTP) superfamily phosphohydrolase (DUF442 family)
MFRVHLQLNVCRMKNWTLSFTLVVTAPAFLACANEAAPLREATSEVMMTSATDTTLAIATEMGVLNARMPLDGLITAGQPTQEQFEALRSSGLEHFVSLRPVTEDGAGWEEALLATGGFAFDRFPISGTNSLTRENVELFAAIMAEVGEKRALLYCASSNRVGAMLALKAHWVDGESAEEALEFGLSAGLTSLEGSVRELLGLAPRTP